MDICEKSKSIEFLSADHSASVIEITESDENFVTGMNWSNMIYSGSTAKPVPCLIEMVNDATYEFQNDCTFQLSVSENYKFFTKNAAPFHVALNEAMTYKKGTIVKKIPGYSSLDMLKGVLSFQYNNWSGEFQVEINYDDPDSATIACQASDGSKKYDCKDILVTPR